MGGFFCFRVAKMSKKCPKCLRGVWFWTLRGHFGLSEGVLKDLFDCVFLKFQIERRTGDAEKLCGGGFLSAAEVQGVYNLRAFLRGGQMTEKRGNGRLILCGLQIG